MSQEDDANSNKKPKHTHDPAEQQHHHHHHHHHHHDENCNHGPRLPVIVLTGYLGAGKTTILNHILRKQQDLKLAVIENEIGEVSIDDSLVEQKQQETAEELVVLDNGCICCTIRQDLVTTLLKIAAKYQNGQRLDGVLIELTGAADPAPVVQTFFMKPEIGQSFFVDNVVALVDAKHAIQKLDESTGNPEEKGTACAQIAFSSTVLLNKIDLAEKAELDKIELRIKELNTTAEVIRCQNATVPVAKLFNVGAFDLSKVLKEAAPFNGFVGSEEDFGKEWMKPKMDRSISNVGVRCGGQVSMFLFQELLNKYLGTEEAALEFLRVKAVLNIAGSQEKYVLQAIHMLKSQNFIGSWKPGEAQENKIIFIGRGMKARRQELTDAFKACLAQPLRFAIGTEVQAKTGDGNEDEDYENGRVVRLWEDTNAYRIRLLKGDDVMAPHDDDSFVRAAV